MKQKTLIIILSQFITTLLYSQVGYVLFAPQGQSKAYLYKTASSTCIVDSIVNDSIEEIFYCVTIERTTKRRAYVSTFEDYNSMTLHKGWVDWQELGIRLQGDTTILRSRPDYKSKVTVVIDDWPGWGVVYHITKAKQGWLYIDDKNEHIKGWIAPEYQCANPYTTCN